MKDTEFNGLLNRITEEVMRRLADGGMPLPDFDAAQPGEEPDACTVVLVPSVVPFQKKAVASLREHFGMGLVFVSFGGLFHEEGQRVVEVREENRGEILHLLEESINVVLLSPPLHAVRRIAAADDEDFLTWLFLRARLWGRKVGIYLDFSLPNYRKAPYGEHVSDLLSALETLGVPLEYYMEESPEEPEEERTLITESDVQEVYRSGKKEIVCRQGAIVTPLALDRAKELGLAILKSGR